MKKTYLILAASTILCGNNLLAQTQLYNGDFENWTIAGNGTDSLEGWSSGNAVVMTPVISLVRTTDAHLGTNAARVITATFGFVQYTTIGILVNGSATFSYGGGGNTDNVVYTGGGGTPISYKPEALSGFYKYETLAVDHGVGKVLLTRYDMSLQQRDTVSYGEINFTPQAAYTSFSIPLTDLMPGVMPDSITTIFYSSDSATVPQFSVFSDLFLDSLTLSPAGPTNIPDAPKDQLSIGIFPNPNNGCFTLINQQQKAMTIGVYDMVGKKVSSITMAKGKSKVYADLQHLAAGTYILMQEANKLQQQKLLIVR